MSAAVLRAKGVDAPALLAFAGSVLRMHGTEDVGRAHAVVQSYRDLVDVLRARRKALGMSAIELDGRAGWSEGMTAKLENWEQGWGRGAGPIILPLWLQSLGMAMVLCEKEPAPVKPRREHNQMELPLSGGRMNPVRLVGKGAKRSGYRR